MPQDHPGSENKLQSDRYEAFLDALETLYIKNNLGGRNAFSKEWPQAARYIFGAELMGYDADGATDRDHRAVLEGEAEVRRLALVETALKLEEKSVDKGALQLGYVEDLVKELGRDVALLLYAPKIVDRFIPPPVVKEEPVPAAAPTAPQPPPRPVVKTMPEALDDIRPISVEPQAAPAPVSEPPEDDRPIEEPKAPAAPPPVAPFAPSAPAIKPIVRPPSEGGES